MLTIIERDRGELTKNDEIRKELMVLAQARGGLTPQAVLGVAKNPRSILHDYFTWDDTEAAAKWREAQAYDLIRRVKVTIETEERAPITVRAFWPVKQVADDGTVNMGHRGTYLPIEDALGREDALEQIMRVAKGELRAFMVKYSKLEGLAEMSAVFEAIREAIEG
jgi:hypothetical protein